MSNNTSYHINSDIEAVNQNDLYAKVYKDEGTGIVKNEDIINKQSNNNFFITICFLLILLLIFKGGK
jgi:hypothetical protein